jgi:hypothetical protein
MSVRIKDEAELRRLGYEVDPANPTRAVAICRIGKLEELDEAALVALHEKRYRQIEQAEVSLARLYWEWGAVLFAIQRLHHRSWTRWKNKNLNARRADKALRIYRRYESPDEIEGKTVEEALDYASRATTPRHGEAYLLRDGRSVLYDVFVTNEVPYAYQWDGHEIVWGELREEDILCSSLVEIAAPSDGQLIDSWLDNEHKHEPEEENTQQEEDAAPEEDEEPCTDEDHEADEDHQHDPAPLRVVGGVDDDTKPSLATSSEDDGPAWLVEYVLRGEILVNAKTADEAKQLVAKPGNPKDWDEVFDKVQGLPEVVGVTREDDEPVSRELPPRKYKREVTPKP